MIKDAYEALRKRLKGLPAFEELDEEFEISALENEQFLLRGVKKAMSERFENISTMLGDLVHPSSESMSLMYEWRFFDPKEKKLIYTIYKRVQFLLRAFDEAELIQIEDHDVKIVCEFLIEWKSLRKQCIPFATRLKEAWTKEEDNKKELGYLG